MVLLDITKKAKVVSSLFFLPLHLAFSHDIALSVVLL